MSVELRVENNAWWTAGGEWSFRWAGQLYGSMQAWQAGSGHEQVNGASSAITADPRVVGLGQGRTIGDAALLHTLEAYRLEAGSPLAAAGMDLQTHPALESSRHPGARDFWGNPLAPAALPVGVHAPAL